MRKQQLLIVSIVIVVLVVAVGAASAQGMAGNGNGFGRQGNGQGMMNGQGQPNGQGMLNNSQGQFNNQPNGQGQLDGTTNNFGRGTRGNAAGAINPMGLNLPPAVAGTLPDDVIAAITAGLMDEYNAYNVYQAIIDQFGAVRPFTNIQRAEAQHIAALEVIFNRYGIEIPEAPVLETVPTFTSLTDACQTAAAAEIANFGLYDQWLETASDYPDITQVFTVLRNASEFNHLPVFENCAG